MYLSKNRLISLWLCSAAVVTIARILHAADLGYDLTLQIQAAQNLLEGNGLSIYSLTGEDDLAKPSQLITLTQFPSGYSFCSAALIAMGFNVGAVIKACGAAATILGWWGWGKLAYAFFREAWEHGRVWRWAGSAIAIASPLLFTPPWKGTDIFLWAAVPWVLGCLSSRLRKFARRLKPILMRDYTRCATRFSQKPGNTPTRLHCSTSLDTITLKPQCGLA